MEKYGTGETFAELLDMKKRYFDFDPICVVHTKIPNYISIQWGSCVGLDGVEIKLQDYRN